MKYIIVLMLCIFVVGCGRFKRNRDNLSATCESACSVKYSNLNCGPIIRGEHIGMTPEEDLVCRCFTYEKTGDASPNIIGRKEIGTIIRARVK